jgi:hypothetical protein
MRRDATAMFEALRRRDPSTFVAYTYPRFKELVGEPSIISAWQNGAADLKARGISLRSVTAGQPGPIVTAGAELYALLPVRLVVKAPGGELHGDRQLLAVSGDEGRRWTFIETSELTALQRQEGTPRLRRRAMLNLPGRAKDILPLLFSNYEPALELLENSDP